MLWVVLFFFMQSVGELFISPIGYSMIGELAPRKLQGMFMGSWMMVVGVAAVISNYFSQLAIKNSIMGFHHANDAYGKIFLELGSLAFVVGIICLCLIPFLNKLIKSNKELPAESPLLNSAPEEPL